LAFMCPGGKCNDVPGHAVLCFALSNLTYHPKVLVLWQIVYYCLLFVYNDDNIAYLI